MKAAIHGLEIPFVFGQIGVGRDPILQVSGPDAQRLSEQMLGAWAAFAEHEKPDVDGLSWAPYDNQPRATMVYNKVSELVDAPFDEELACRTRLPLTLRHRGAADT